MNQTMKCPSCGATVEFDPGGTPVVRCPYCQTSIIIPTELRQPASIPVQMFQRPGWSDQILQPAQVASIQELARLAHQGDKIEAIKIYRQVFGASLQESIDAVESIHQGHNISIPQTSTPGPFLQDKQVKDEVSRLLQDGRKIEAIKYYRQVTGQSLKDSKEAVDNFQSNGSFNLHASPGAYAAENIYLAVSLVSVVELVQAGEEQAAISAYQGAFGVGFAEAHEAVHKITLGVTQEALSIDPTRQTFNTIKIPEVSSKAMKTTAGVVGGISCLWVFGVIAVILITVVPVLFALSSSGGPLEFIWNQINPMAYARVSLRFGEEGRAPGMFDDPRQMTIDPQENLLIANYSDGRVQKFDSSGDYMMLWNIGPEKYVSGIASDQDGAVYLVYRGGLWKYASETGELLGRMAENMDAWFEVVATTADNGVVAAVNTEQIMRFDSKGNLVFSLADIPGTQSGKPDRIQDIAVDGVGGMYVLSDRSTINIYTPQGRLVTRFGSAGDEQGQLRAPSAIAVDGLGNIYISDIKGIQVFTNDGRYLDRIETEGFAFGMEFDAQGALWVVTNLPKVFKYEIVGR